MFNWLIPIQCSRQRKWKIELNHLWSFPCVQVFRNKSYRAALLLKAFDRQTLLVERSSQNLNGSAAKCLVSNIWVRKSFPPTSLRDFACSTLSKDISYNEFDRHNLHYILHFWPVWFGKSKVWVPPSPPAPRVTPLSPVWRHASSARREFGWVRTSQWVLCREASHRRHTVTAATVQLLDNYTHGLTHACADTR